MPKLFPYWDAPQFVQCPHCHVAYECERIGIHFSDTKQFTVKCNCGESFDVDVAPRSFSKPDMKVTPRWRSEPQGS